MPKNICVYLYIHDSAIHGQKKQSYENYSSGVDKVDNKSKDNKNKMMGVKEWKSIHRHTSTQWNIHNLNIVKAWELPLRYILEIPSLISQINNIVINKMINYCEQQLVLPNKITYLITINYINMLTNGHSDDHSYCLKTKI